MKSKVMGVLPRLRKRGEGKEAYNRLSVDKERDVMGFGGVAEGSGGEKEETTILAGVHTEVRSDSEAWVSGGSNVSSSSVGDPEHTPSHPVSLVNSRMSVRQNIIEPGANRWEVHGLWAMKRCTRTIRRSVSKMMILVVLSIVVVGFTAFHCFSGPEREVKKFLTEIGLVEYYDDFINEKYTWLEDVVHISNVGDLQAIGMTYRSHQERFLRHAEKIRNQESLVLAIMWAILILMIVCSMIVVISVLIFEEARNRAAFFVTWCCLMLW